VGVFDDHTASTVDLDSQSRVSLSLCTKSLKVPVNHWHRHYSATADPAAQKHTQVSLAGRNAQDMTDRRLISYRSNAP
jgi:uncharacterized protein YciW